MEMLRFSIWSSFSEHLYMYFWKKIISKFPKQIEAALCKR